MTSFLRLLLLAASISFTAGSALTQTTVEHNRQSDSVFARATQLFRDGKYAEAVTRFSTLLALKPAHQHTTASYLMAAKAYNALKQYDSAIIVLNKFFHDFPDSKYRQDARYTLAVSELLSRRYREAAIELQRVVDAEGNGEARSRASALLHYLADKRLNYQDVLQFPSTAPAENARDAITLIIADRLYREGSKDSARVLLDSVIARRPGSQFSVRAESLRTQIGRWLDLRIGVLLPVTENENNTSFEQASEMLDGIKYALQRKRPSFPASMNILIDIHDVGRDPQRAKQSMEELAGKEQVVAVIGPMFSNLAFACAPTANADSVPMISPTANAVGLAATGPFVFQLHPDAAIQGRALARHAVQKSGFTKFAIVAPADEAMRPLVANFFSEVQALGGRIVTVELYGDPAATLDRHCLNLRKAGAGGEPKISFAGRLSKEQVAGLAARGVTPATIDSLRKAKAEIPVADLLGPFGSLIADSLNLPVLYPKVNARDLNQSMAGIEAIFAPVIDPEHVSIILSQFSYHNIIAQVIGSAEWNNTAVLDANKQSAQQAVFPSDTYIDRENPLVQTFGREYYQASQKSPSRYTMFGFDAMDLVLEQLLHGATNRLELAKALGRSRYQGIHTAVSLEGGRVNSMVNILQYTQGGIKRIDEVSGR